MSMYRTDAGRKQFRIIMFAIFGVLVSIVLVTGSMSPQPTAQTTVEPAKTPTESPPPPAPLIYVLARAPDYPDRYAHCEIELLMVNRSSKVVSMSGTVQAFTKYGGDGTGYFRFEFVGANQEKLIKARIDTYCNVSSPGLKSVIVREINTCKLSGDYYRDCGTITAPGYWQADVKNTIPLTIDLK